METTLFVTKEYLEKQFRSFNNTLVKPNDKKIKGWLSTLNGNVDVEGSIANTIAKKIAEVISGAPEDYDTLKEIADWISNHASNAEEMLAKIEANKEGILSENEKIDLVEGIINTLNGNEEVEGSIAKMLKDAITTSVDNIILCESEDEDIDFNNANWLKGETEPVVFTASDIVGDRATLTSYVVPEGVTRIDDSAFRGCSSLTSVDIPEGVTEIGNSAFEGCSNLESIALPSTLKKIGENAFRSCKSLTSIEIPEDVTDIGEAAFQNCPNLESVTLPSTLTEIENSAFRGCTSLTSIVIPEDVTEIGDNTFNSCTKLTSVTLPSTLTKIGNQAFYNCKTLESIDIPEGVTEIGDKAFWNCTSLTSIVIPEGVTNIGSYAFSDWSKVIFAEGSLFKKENGTIYNTETGVLVACYDKTITSIVIPEGVTEIGNSAFGSCNKLTSVTLPSTLKKIVNNAFTGCSSLTSINIPEGVTEIGNQAFRDWSVVTFAEGSPFKKENGIIWNPETGVLLGCYDKTITSIVIPEGVTEIGNQVFYGCDNLRSVTIPNTVTTIGSAFSNCPYLTSIDIPASVTEINYSAFNVSVWSKVTFAEGSPFKKENGIIWNTETGVLFRYYDRDTITSIVIPE